MEIFYIFKTAKCTCLTFLVPIDFRKPRVNLLGRARDYGAHGKGIERSIHEVLSTLSTPVFRVLLVKRFMSRNRTNFNANFPRASSSTAETTTGSLPYSYGPTEVLRIHWAIETFYLFWVNGVFHWFTKCKKCYDSYTRFTLTLTLDKLAKMEAYAILPLV